ncbi:MAG: glycosyltransferase family 2 protein [candidate division KSB1 bacterium]|nr:glycosyltransferase family 2 protein [candidate division KSB1 bacterium]MDZ7365333.1 glycosyltransferase family 2 protein [candidate division KSB1 bacterium]MDZ7403200.1 glycosyltransferase family 2 protein [candidate division KSB1 bacterium]
MPAQNFSHPRPESLRVDVVIPVYNEEKDLPRTVATLREFLQQNCPYAWRIVIADNASIDHTPAIGRSLAAQHEEVRYLRLALKGRGRALRQAWLTSDADILSYMDVDLSTDLQGFMPMIEALANGQADMAIGSRYKKGAQVKRGLKREILSRGYITLIKLFFGCGFSDSQCGFKAITRRAAHTLVPLIENQGWFFDAELLLLAEHYGFRIFEVPVRWVDDSDSRVKIVQTVSEHFIGLVRLRLAFSTGFAVAPAPAPRPLGEAFA